MLQHPGQGNSAMVYSSGNEGGNRFGEIKGIDLVETEVAVLQRVKQFGVSAGPRAKGFQGDGMVATAPQVGKEERGQQGFADAGVRAGYEENATAAGLR